MKNTITEINVKDKLVGILKVNNIDYISLTDIAKAGNASEPSFVIKNWLRKIDTINYIGLWEQLHNNTFNLVEFDQIKKEYGRNSFSISPNQWIKRTNSIGIVASSGRYSIGTFAHPDIAFEFASWISPEFKLYLITEFERLKKNESRINNIEWNVSRNLSKIGYQIHTYSINQNIIPILTDKDKKRIYASEADILNVALFGITAEEWRKKNSNLKGNIRDNTDILHLIILNNLEILNADMIERGISPEKRLIRLNEIARKHMELLINNQNIRLIEKNK